MNKAFLTIVTENQNQKRKADKLADLLKSQLGENCSITNIEKYHKFDNSYKIELAIIFQKADYNIGIPITDKIASPWLVYFDNEENSMELIFNKTENSQFRKIEFKAIKWGHWQMMKKIRSKPKTNFLPDLSAPAKRALENKGISTLLQLSKHTEADILALHGIGKSSIPKLKKALQEQGLSFK